MSKCASAELNNFDGIAVLFGSRLIIQRKCELLTMLAITRIDDNTAIAINATKPESCSVGCRDGCSARVKLTPLLVVLASTRMKNFPSKIDYNANYCKEIFNAKLIYSQSSTHVNPSSDSLRPVGHAHDIFGLCGRICGAGKHK